MTGTGFAAGAPLGGSPAAQAAGPNHGVSSTYRSAEIHKTSWKRHPSGYRLILLGIGVVFGALW